MPLELTPNVVVFNFAQSVTIRLWRRRFVMSERDGLHVIRGLRMMYDRGSWGKHEAYVEVIFSCVMKSNDLSGCLKLAFSAVATANERVVVGHGDISYVNVATR
jgi:hypothetical protein